MIQYIKTAFLALIMYVPCLTKAQENLFDCENSHRFAQFLYNTSQFELAVHELERVHFLCKADSSTQLLLLQAYRKTRNFNNANQFFGLQPIEKITSMSEPYRNEFIRLQMAQGRYGDVKRYIESGFDFKEKHEHLLGSALLLKDWNQAYLVSQNVSLPNTLKINGLKSVAERSYSAKRKKPWLATAMSVIVPGSGKMYAGYWADGVMSFLFTASSGFFAYRAFNRYGPDKVYPWVAGGLAVSYYTANIYGAGKAAAKYNNNLDHQFLHETERILFSDY
jgi:hypothetical protein